MPYNSNVHHCKSIRLKGYDYSRAGLYFITICVQNRWCLYGNVVDGEMRLNDAGLMVENEWLKLPQRFTNIELHEFVVMPNHFHAIIEFVGAPLVVAQHNTTDNNDVVDQNDMAVQSEHGQPQVVAPTCKSKTLGDLLGAFKSIVTVECIRGVKQFDWTRFNGKLWQRDYWEHIIRNEPSYQRISQYIINNPKNWDRDKLNGK